MEREFTREENMFFLTRGLVQQRRDTLVEEVKDFIKAEFPADPEKEMGFDIDEFIRELLEDTGWTLGRCGIERITEVEDDD